LCDRDSDAIDTLNICKRAWPQPHRLSLAEVRDLVKLVPASDSSLLAVFGDTISPALHERVIALFQALQSGRDPRIRNLHPGYASLLIDFDPLRLTHAELSVSVQQIAHARETVVDTHVGVTTIPVCYDLDLGPDLPDVAQHAGLPPEEIVRQHSAPTYLVYFLGFSPGFVYLGGLPEPLRTPRLATPRPSIAAGSIGIADGQTGIYPVDSPGGWRLIGRTPVRMFDPEATPPTPLQPGDRMRFSPIDRATFDDMQQDLGTRHS